MFYKTLHLKQILPALLVLGCLNSCKNDERRLVSSLFIDSLITHYAPPAIAVENEKELVFWKSRINPAMTGYLNESRYAGCLNMQFRFSGEIDSLRKADSVLLKIDRDFNHKEASTDMAMVAHCITRHRFSEADSFLQVAKRLGLRPHESFTTSFDVDFELGRYPEAKTELNAIRSTNDFGYYFRKSKIDHLEGELDSSIRDMDEAARLAGGNDYLKGVALSNAGDLCIHAGNLSEARDVYMQCIRLNSGDVHSLMGLGWIALVHDRDYSLAERIFRFAQSKTRLPDPLFKLTQMAGAQGDTALQARDAQAFVRAAMAPDYGRMYNKYLIQLYTGVLHHPALADSIAKDELNNRATPQTYAWYAWALLADHKMDQAYEVYQQHVSGKPLEGLELYWMGRLMEALDKGYNAREFFKAADKTRYDLDPADAKYIQGKLEE